MYTITHTITLSVHTLVAVFTDVVPPTHSGVTYNLRAYTAFKLPFHSEP